MKERIPLLISSLALATSIGSVFLSRQYQNETSRYQSQIAAISREAELNLGYLCHETNMRMVERGQGPLPLEECKRFRKEAGESARLVPTPTPLPEIMRQLRKTPSPPLRGGL